ncbi:MAG TPA: suppressor of fused domain protein [Solirubrobacteraceae bacterium]|nr:suppressor of fused domain protein [Solirubrobacteraceae bacterium]
MSFSDHLEEHYPECTTAFIAPARAGVEDLLPGFRVLRVAPAQAGEPWVYATCGAAQSAADGEPGAEYVLLTPGEDAALVEMLATLAVVNAAAEENFGVGSIIALGRSWLARSWARHLLVLPPYPFPPGFDVYEDGERRTVVLWLVPILSAEAQYVRAHGHEALEQIFEQRKSNVADPARTSVV